MLVRTTCVAARARRLAVTATAAIAAACAETPTLPAVPGRWQPPEVIADAGERPMGFCSLRRCRRPVSDFAPRVALHGDGAGVALWNDRTGNRPRRVASRFLPARGWSGLSELPPTDWYQNQKVALGPNGNALAVWDFTNPEGVRSSHLRGEAWSDVVPVGVGHDPMLRMDAHGRASLLFVQAMRSLYYARFDGDAGWTEPELVYGEPPAADGVRDDRPIITSHSLGVAANGSTVVAWVRQSLSPDESWSEVWIASPAAGRATRAISRFDGRRAGHVVTATDGRGRSLVLFGLDQEVWAQHSPARAAGWTPPYRVSEPSPEPTAARSFSRRTSTWRLTHDGTDRILFVWIEGEYPSAPPFGASFNLRSRTFRLSTRSWGEIRTLIAGTGTGTRVFPSYDLRLAGSANGHAVVAWNGERNEVWAITAHEDLWGPATRLSSSPPGLPVSTPDTGIDSNGNALVVWAEEAGIRAHIRAARYVR